MEPTPAAPSTRPSRWPPPAPIAIAIAATLLCVWGVAVLTAVLGARESLTTAEGSLDEARTALADGDLDVALGHLTWTSALLDRARGKLFRPDVSLAAAVPWVTKDLHIARAITAGADDLVEAGRVALEHASEIAGSDLPDGALPIGALQALAPDVRAAAVAAVAALERIEASPRVGFTRQTGTARRDILALLRPVVDELQVAADVVEVLPSFLGADGPRRYFLGAANPAELRGVSGYLGSYAILTIADGELDFGTFQPLFDLRSIDAGAIPEDLLAPRYARFGGTREWKNANMTPDMPSAARTLTAMWHARTGEVLDGVIIVDPFALATMLEVTGPVETPEGITLTAENAVRYLTNEAYVDFDDSSDRKEALGENAKIVFERFLGDAANFRDRISDLADLVSERQMLLYATDPTTQAAFARAKIDGAFPDPEGEFIAVVANSASNTKVDYYLQRRLTIQVDLAADGDSEVHLDVDMTNTAPRDAEPSYVLGPALDGLDVGDNRFYLSTYCSTHCELASAVAGTSGRALVEEELGHPVAGLWMQLVPGQTTRVRYAWRTARSWVWEGDELVYRLTVRAQTAIRAPDVDVAVTMPPGFTLAGGSDDVHVVGDTAVWVGQPRGDVSLSFRLRAA